LRTPPEGAPSFAPTNWGELRQYSDIPETGPLTDAQARQLIHGYYATVSYVDAQLGRVLGALEELGLARDTTIVLWGDHGWHLGDHGQWCKHTNYEEAAHIPLIMVAPEIAAGRRTNALVESVDLYPTLCELAGISAPPNLDGQSFTALLQNASAPTKEAVFHVYPRGDLIGRAVRTARFRLVEWKKPDAPAESAILELYDYQQDPAEKKNHASEQTAVVNELRALLARQPEAKPQIKSAADEAKVASDRAAMFARRDKDADGQLTREEFLDKQPDPAAAPKRFEKFDVNHDGVLSREEFIMMGGTAKK
jgi:iduronate 2-sulfatase